MKNNEYIAVICGLNSIIMGELMFFAIIWNPMLDLPALTLYSVALLAAVLFAGYTGIGLFLLITRPWEKQK